MSNIHFVYVKINGKHAKQIPMDSGQRTHSDEFKLDIYLKITQLQLQYDDSVAAESSLNRAAPLVANSNNNQNKIIYKVFKHYYYYSVRYVNRTSLSFGEAEIILADSLSSCL